MPTFGEGGLGSSFNQKSMSDLFFEAIPEPNIVLSCSKLGVDTADVRTRLFSITDYRGTLVILEVWDGRMDGWTDGQMDGWTYISKYC